MIPEAVFHDVLDGLDVLSAVETGESVFRARPGDDAAAAGLRNGVVTISKVEYPATPDTVFGVVPDDNRAAVLEVNSLRFLEPLRRTRGQGDSAAQDAALWLSFVRSWIQGADDDTRRWAFLPASQRAVVLALGLRDFWPEEAQRPDDVVELLERHLTVFTDKLRGGRVQMVEDALLRAVASMSMTAQAGAGERIQEVLGTFRDAYLAQDLAPGGTVATTTAMTQRWTSLFNRLSQHAARPQTIDPDHRIGDLWVHATRPDGSIAPIGGANVPVSWDERTPVTSAETYAATSSDSGEATDDLLYTHPAGWVFGRRSWGETERNFDEETFFSFRHGRLESDERHDDNASLTFSARGHHWLDDLPSAEHGWSARDRHSTVSIDGRYRTHSDTELTRIRSTDQSFDLEVRDRAYLPVAFTRRLVYSRTGDYLVVIDQTRSADPHHGTQNWMVPPGIAVERTPKGVTLTCEDARCEMVWLNVPAPELIIEPVEAPETAQDARPWTRVAVPFTGASNRLVTALIPADREEPIECSRQPMEEGSLSLSISRGKHSEQLIITKEAAGAGAIGDDSEALAERIRNEALTGGLSLEEQEQQRQHIRAELTQIKDEVWAGHGELAVRESSLERLFALADRSRITGFRDLGLGAAMIDVAGTDLRQRVASHPLVSRLKRTPVIAWNPESPLVHDFYQVPIQTFRDFTPTVDLSEPRQMITFDFGQLALPLFVSRARGGDTLTIMFHGATDRSRNAMPRFERLRSMESLGTGPALFVSDPCLDLDASQILTWYIGDEGFNLHEFLARQIRSIAHQLGCNRVLYVGNSGGGFAALQVSSHDPESAAVVFNPQIQLDRYVPRIRRTAQEVLFGTDEIPEDHPLRERVDVIRRYQSIGFNKHVFFIQNTGDEMHHDHHYIPFRHAFEESGKIANLKSHTPYLGPGHRVPPPDEYTQLVREGMGLVFGRGH